MANKQKTDLQVANEALVALSVNVSASDRQECPSSEVTIVKYLKGEGKDLDTAMKLLQFFRQRIENRRKVLNGTEVKEAQN